MKLTMNDLEKCFNEAIEKKLKYVAVKFSDSKNKKTIIYEDNLNIKIKDFKICYDDNLKNIIDNEREIIDFSNGNTYLELEKNLKYNKQEISITIDLNIDTNNIEKIIEEITESVNKKLLENIEIYVR